MKKKGGREAMIVKQFFEFMSARFQFKSIKSRKGKGLFSMCHVITDFGLHGDFVGSIFFLGHLMLWLRSFVFKILKMLQNWPFARVSKCSGD